MPDVVDRRRHGVRVAGPVLEKGDEVRLRHRSCARVQSCPASHANRTRGVKGRFRQQCLVVEHLPGRPAPDNVAVGHHADAVSNPGGKFGVVCRQDDADTVLVNLRDPVGDHPGPFGVETGERLRQLEAAAEDDEPARGGRRAVGAETGVGDGPAAATDGDGPADGDETGAAEADGGSESGADADAGSGSGSGSDSDDGGDIIVA